ncbi:MAG: GAF domain-containing sensor histidine kinase [Chloroflexi bacterium]|nr:GAF domain-containing sensor histidine kinase [Chloroflexota bacterium]
MTNTQDALEELRALTEAGVALTSELALETVLQRVVDIARELIGARYAALSVLGPSGEITRFITSGVSAEEREAIGDVPSGKGLLGVLLHEGDSLRLETISGDPRSASFPPSHPHMTSLLGVPLIFRSRIIGNLYLTDKIGERGFSDHDEELVRLLATQAAVAIRNAELHDKAESVARLEERERIGMDLHDGVMQSIYAVGLTLEDCGERVDEAPDEVKVSLEGAINALNDVIGDIRSYIFDLRPRVSVVADLPEAIRHLVDDLRINTLIQTSLEIDGELSDAITQDQALALFHITQEALNNVAKHSQAKSASVRLACDEHTVSVEVRDDGIGFDAEREQAHERHGLRNMRDRARSIGARLHLIGKANEGTTVRAELSIGDSAEAP